MNRGCLRPSQKWRPLSPGVSRLVYRGKESSFADSSQGACLGTEFAARHPSRYGALIAFTGGLIGPSDSNLQHAGSLDGTPALLSSGDPDPHVPWERVKASAGELERMGARVELMRHAGRPHTIVSSELQAANVIVHNVLSTAK